MIRQGHCDSPFDRTEAERRAECLVMEAEASKACLYDVSGRNELNPPFEEPGDPERGFSHSMVIDESYDIISSHVDGTLREKIWANEYIDFSKLLHRDRVKAELDRRMELVNRGGMAYYVPVNDSISISGFNRWEQAFRIYSSILTQKFPQKAPELLEYNNIINLALQSFVWHNVYAYDVDFHLHMARNPTRLWSSLLQKAWTLRLKDRLSRGEDQGQMGDGNGRKFRPKREICKRFNKGKCKDGLSCKYNHRCLGCGKFGHGVHICRHSNADVANQPAPQTVSGGMVDPFQENNFWF